MIGVVSNLTTQDSLGLPLRGYTMTSKATNKEASYNVSSYPGRLVGYVRVSSTDQNTDRQLDGLTLNKAFTDTASGKDTKRPALEACLDFLYAGDTLFVHSMDRLARNLDDLRKIVKELTAKGVKVRFVKESLEFTGEDSSMSNLLLSLLGAVAEFERSLIKERQREGIALAKSKGVYKGRNAKLTAARVVELKVRMERRLAGETVEAIANDFGISRQTLYTYIKKAD